ncbi:MAG TPA: acetyl-CoA carboxylase biotin carboxylase subunit [Firmicutes bacterium]|nr:acetyl-CoA carboxylase biotin carboxylase subunit [Bacillota bacterium]
MFKKILIANRGEIAVRIIRACRELNIPTATIYSEADATALHVQEADEAVCVGPPAPLESYLNQDRIVQEAKKLGCDAIHPGYGFLAENGAFAKKIEDAGMVFIGPPAHAIALMGNKIESRQAMVEAKVPVIPGMQAGSADFKHVAEEARRIGYPVLVKAASGGGGKGMRRVESPSELKAALEGASREAEKAFGDATVYIEKWIIDPRHIEFQIMADSHGNVVHLFERECSIQRRHQKIVEETPSVALYPELRARMGETACKVAKTAGYRSAGTVEFLLAPDDSFYFLEMNTRIQVEHPITELVVGVDLVQEQIRIAAGNQLSFRQDQLQQRGHAIECRIYAEDPANNFLPQSGPLLFVREPSGPGVRVDSGIYGGSEVSTYYDPILSKLIVHGPNREAARLRMIRALRDYTILGIRTNIPFLIDVLRHIAFVDGATYTDFIPRNLPNWPEGPGALVERRELHTDIATIGAAVIDHLGLGKKYSAGAFASAGREDSAPDPWDIVGSWEIAKER